MKNLSILALVVTSAFAASATAQTPVKPTEAHAAPAKSPDVAVVVRDQKPAYPLTTCIVSKRELKNGETVDHVVNGRLIRLCCSDCVASVAKDPAAAIRKVDEAVVAAQKPTYPLKVCAVSGESLGDGAVDHVYGTRLVRLANADAVAAFDKDPKSAMIKVDRALIEAQRKTYPLKTCVVSDEAIGTDPSMEPYDYLYGTRLVRLCCKSCVRSFEKDPAANLKKIAAATSK